MAAGGGWWYRPIGLGRAPLRLVLVRARDTQPFSALPAPAVATTLPAPHLHHTHTFTWSAATPFQYTLLRRRSSPRPQAKPGAEGVRLMSHICSRTALTSNRPPGRVVNPAHELEKKSKQYCSFVLMRAEEVGSLVAGNKAPRTTS